MPDRKKNVKLYRTQNKIKIVKEQAILLDGKMAS